MKQYEKITFGVLISVVAMALAYAELTADAALNGQLGIETKSAILHVRSAQ
jgi:hypothetical protein